MLKPNLNKILAATIATVSTISGTITLYFFLEDKISGKEIKNLEIILFPFIYLPSYNLITALVVKLEVTLVS